MLLTSKIFQRFFFAFFALSLVPLNLVTWMTLRQGREEICRQTLTQLRIAADGAEAQVSEYLNYLKYRTAGFCSDTFIRDSVVEAIQHPENKQNIERLNYHLSLNKLPTFPECVEIFILNPKGMVVASSHSPSIGNDFSQTDSFSKGQLSMYMGDIVCDTKTGMTDWMASAPLLDKASDTLIGVLVNRINPKTLSDITTGKKALASGAVSQSARFGKTGETYIINREKLMITESRYLDDVILKQVVDTELAGLTMQQEVSALSDYPDYRGVPVFGASAVYKELGWIVITEIDYYEAFIPIQKLQMKILILAGTLLCGIFLVSWMLTVRFTKPILRLVQANRQVVQGDIAGAYIPDREIPADELGVLMRSRNVMLSQIEEGMQTLKQKTEELRKLSAVIEQSVNVVFIVDVAGLIEYVNPMFEQVTGYSKEEAIGQNPRILASGETTRAEYEELWKTITAGRTWRGVFKNKKKNGHYYWGNGLISPMRNEVGQIAHFLAVQEDITEKKQSEERAQYLASYDELTCILNRMCFTAQLNEWISCDKTVTQTGALLLINIDKFRLINDTYGHSVGDNLLRRVAMFLRTTLFDIDKRYVNKDTRESILGRMGGDEFAIFLPSRDEKEGMESAECIRKRLESIQFVEITGSLSASIGVVLYPRHGVTVRELFIKTDAAVFRAKELGYNRSHLYCPDDLVLEKMHSRIEWKGRIQKALEEDRFEPWFQPILDLKDKSIHHYEALARMRDEEGKILLPGTFIDVAEQFGLIAAIDRAIIEKTMRLQAIFSKRRAPFFLSMNLSGKDFGDLEVLEFLKSAITKTGAAPQYLIFEITETAAIYEFNKAVKFIKALKSMGCSFALDDFGVGFTSFQYLKELEVDYVKIDGSFVRKLHESKSDRLFVKAIADVAKGLGIKTIAEFVENEEAVTVLMEYGVGYAQGYFIGKPAPNI